MQAHLHMFTGLSYSNFKEDFQKHNPLVKYFDIDVSCLVAKQN